MNISTYESQIKALEAGGGGGGTGGGNINFNSITPIEYRIEQVDANTSKYYIPKTDFDRINQDPPIVLVLSNVIDDTESSSDIIYLERLSIYEGSFDTWEYMAVDTDNASFISFRMLGPGEYRLMRAGASDEAEGVYDSVTDSYSFTVSFM